MVGGGEDFDVLMAGARSVVRIYGLFHVAGKVVFDPRVRDLNLSSTKGSSRRSATSALISAMSREDRLCVRHRSPSVPVT